VADGRLRKRRGEDVGRESLADLPETLEESGVVTYTSGRKCSITNAARICRNMTNVHEMHSTPVIQIALRIANMKERCLTR
jgi:hypothetical protein